MDIYYEHRMWPIIPKTLPAMCPLWWPTRLPTMGNADDPKYELHSTLQIDLWGNLKGPIIHLHKVYTLCPCRASHILVLLHILLSYDTHTFDHTTFFYILQKLDLHGLHDLHADRSNMICMTCMSWMTGMICTTFYYVLPLETCGAGVSERYSTACAICQ